MSKYYFYNETRECTECGKRSRKRCYGYILGAPPFALFNITRHAHGGKTIDSHKCPHCGYQHKVAFRGVKRTFPRVSKSETYYEATEAEAIAT